MLMRLILCWCWWGCWWWVVVIERRLEGSAGFDFGAGELGAAGGHEERIFREVAVLLVMLLLLLLLMLLLLLLMLLMLVVVIYPLWDDRGSEVRSLKPTRRLTTRPAVRC
jgi:hypothetical protein